MCIGGTEATYSYDRISMFEVSAVETAQEWNACEGETRRLNRHSTDDGSEDLSANHHG